VSKLWVPIVVTLGLLVGALLSYAALNEVDEFRGRGFYMFNPEPGIIAHIILSTLGVALLMALLVVYGRVYLQTSANFALGLVIVLTALLLQSILNYPLLLGWFGPIPYGPSFFPSAADVLTVVAYGVFLYLSLE
jgi:hypothetical protein